MFPRGDVVDRLRLRFSAVARCLMRGSARWRSIHQRPAINASALRGHYVHIKKLSPLDNPASASPERSRKGTPNDGWGGIRVASYDGPHLKTSNHNRLQAPGATPASNHHDGQQLASRRAPIHRSLRW